ncbi:hypothetical protein QJQ45_002031 [Haematococcus lacustris]|nr:hypothetical protein QJQ45_002031 [Haematococcus lacustris]
MLLVLRLLERMWACFTLLRRRLVRKAVAEGAGVRAEVVPMSEWAAVGRLEGPRGDQPQIAERGAQRRANKLTKFNAGFNALSGHTFAFCPFEAHCWRRRWAEVSMKRHKCVKQLVVFFGTASIGAGGGWGADAVLRACCKVPGSHTVNSLRAWTQHSPPAKRRKRRLSKQLSSSGPLRPMQGQGCQCQTAQQPGKWVDWDCNAVWNKQRIGESRWRSLEQCWWPDLPAKGKEYSGLGYKWRRDWPPKAQQQQEEAQ